MRRNEPNRRALRGLVIMGGAFVVAGLAWIIAQSLDMHSAAGAVLCGGGAVSAVLNAGASVSAWKTLKETDEGDRTGARGDAGDVPGRALAGVFVFESGRLVLAAHAR